MIHAMVLSILNPQLLSRAPKQATEEAIEEAIEEAPLPPPSPLALLLASILIHSFNHCLSAIFLGSVTFVWSWASPRSKLSSVGMLIIRYVMPRSLPNIYGESYSISQ